MGLSTTNKPITPWKNSWAHQTETAMAKKKTPMPKKLTNIVSIDGQARIQYDPDWGRSQPFLTYLNGTAGGQFSDLATAKRYFMNVGHPFTADDKWT